MDIHGSSRSSGGCIVCAGTRRALTFLHSVGLPPAVARRVVEQHGARAESVLRADPYAVLMNNTGCTFRWARSRWGCTGLSNSKQFQAVRQARSTLNESATLRSQSGTHGGHLVVGVTPLGQTTDWHNTPTAVLLDRERWSRIVDMSHIDRVIRCSWLSAQCHGLNAACTLPILCHA